MKVTELRAIKTEKVPDKDIIADLQALADRAKAGEIEGFLGIFITADGVGFDARLCAADIWEVLGFIEGRVKPKLIDIGNGE